MVGLHMDELFSCLNSLWGKGQKGRKWQGVSKCSEQVDLGKNKTKARDRSMEKGGRDKNNGGARGREETGTNLSRCWLDRGQAVSASSTCCHSEDWGVKLVSAEALRGVRWLWESGKEDREIQRERRKVRTERVDVSIKLVAGIMAELEGTTDWDDQSESSYDRS